jgi:hypothetical protein
VAEKGVQRVLVALIPFHFRLWEFASSLHLPEAEKGVQTGPRSIAIDSGDTPRLFITAALLSIRPSVDVSQNTCNPGIRIMNGRGSQQPEATPLLATGTAAEYGNGIRQPSASVTIGGITTIGYGTTEPSNHSSGNGSGNGSIDGSNGEANNTFSLRNLSSRVSDIFAHHTGTSLLALVVM